MLSIGSLPLKPKLQVAGGVPGAQAVCSSGLELLTSGLTAEMKRHCSDRLRLSHGVPQVTRNLLRKAGIGPPSKPLATAPPQVAPNRPTQLKWPIRGSGSSMKVKV